MAIPIVSWTSFLRFWHANFPKLKVRRSGEDTCSDCWKLRCRLEHLHRQKAAAQCETVEAGDDVGISPDELTDTLTELDDLIKECRKHVDMHTAQRERYNKFFEMAEQCIRAGTSDDEFIKFIVIDMAQNAATPILGSDQPGNFYYMSPLTHLIFGICKPARNMLNAYIWEEGTADRGADNIISCLYLDLMRAGLFDMDRPNYTKLGHLVLGVNN